MSNKILLLAALSLLGCGQGAPDEPESTPGAAAGGPAAAPVVAPTTPVAPAVARTYAAFEAVWPKLSSEEVAVRAHHAAEIVLERSLPLEAFKCAAEHALDHGDEWDDFPLGDRELHVKYYAQKNDLRVTNESLNRESEEDFVRPNALSESQARDVALATFQRMASEHLLRAEHYADLQFKVGTTDFLMGSDVEAETRRVVTQYRFLANRRLNGIAFMNAGFSVGVHASGAISHLRVGGADVHTVAASSQAPGATPALGELPLGKGSVFSSVFDADSAKRRFQADFPFAVVDWNELRYVLPDAATGPTVIDPQQVVSFANHYENAVSRRQYVGYPVRDPNGPSVLVSDAPTPEDTGAPRASSPERPTVVK
jgi:hypothetical protein